MKRTARDLRVSERLDIGGVRVTASAAELNLLDGATVSADEINLLDGVTGALVQAHEVLFTENGEGTYTGSVTLPAGATLHDILINGVALWTAATSAVMKVGVNGGDDDGYYTGINLKATDLLAGESLSFALAGGKAGAFIANSQVSPRYYAAQTVIDGVVTSTGAGTAGRTRMVVIFSVPQAVTNATKA